MKAWTTWATAATSSTAGAILATTHGPHSQEWPRLHNTPRTLVAVGTPEQPGRRASRMPTSLTSTCSAYRPAEVVILGLIAAAGPGLASSHTAESMRSSGLLHMFSSKTAERRDVIDKFEISGAGINKPKTHSATILTENRLTWYRLQFRSDCRLPRSRADASDAEASFPKPA